MRSEYITFAKAYAILTIVLYHFATDLALPGILAKLIGIGGAGVHVFVFASGFGLYLSKYTDIGAFFKRRMFKVLRPYYIVITIIFLVNIKLSLFNDGISAFLSHIFLYKMFVEEYYGSFGGQFWFISTIIQLYLIYPLLLLCVKKYNSLILVAMALIISLAYAITTVLMGYSEVRPVSNFFLQYLWEFVLGMIVAKENLIHRLTNVKWFVSLPVSLVAYLLMAVIILTLGAIGRNVNDIFSFIGYFSFSVFVFNSLKAKPRFLRYFVAVESFSYSLFLTHTFVYVVLIRFVFHQITILNFGLIFVASILAARGFQMFLDKLVFFNISNLKRVIFSNK